MSVRMMVGREKAGLPNVETVPNYNGAEAGRISHSYTCPRKGDYRTMGPYPLEAACAAAGCTVTEPLYMETTHVGHVLATGERNGYDDSDFTATVWNPETGAPETFVYASTRGWTYPNGAHEDATPEVLAAYEAWSARKRAERAAAKAAFEAKLPKVGRRVRVVRGRKVKIGTEAEVFWAGRNKFASRYRNFYGEGIYEIKAERDHERLGLRLADGTKVFTASSNVEVIAEEVVSA